MNDFLEQVWLDNQVRTWLIVAGVILFVIILKTLISRYLAGLLYRLINKIWKNLDKRAFTNLLIQPLGFFLLILVTIVALHKLTFPARLNVDVYDYSLKHIFHQAATVILIVSFIWLLMRILDFVAMLLERKTNQTPDQADNQLVVFFRDFFKVLIVIAGIMMIMSYVFDINVASMITGLSIMGAAIALALRESLENLIASFIIFVDKPFTTGDLVKVHQVTGTVEKIGLRSTRIRSDQKTYVSVPNKQMVDSILDNLSLRTQRRGDIRLEIGLQTNRDSVEKLLAAIKTMLNRKEIEDFNVVFGEITSAALLIQADYYTAPLTYKEFNTIKQEINLQCLKVMEEGQIEMAGASTDIRIQQPGGQD